MAEPSRVTLRAAGAAGGALRHGQHHNECSGDCGALVSRMAVLPA